MARRPIIAGNWKMHLTVAEGLALATAVRDRCARLRDGEVACWGSNEFGQLGDGGRMISARPLEVQL